MQWVPADFAPHLGLRGRAYWLLHVCAVAALFDRERSDWDPLPSRPSVPKRVRRMVLREAPAGAPPLVRLEEVMGVVLVREEVASELSRRVKGPGVFVPVGEFRRGLR